MAHRNFLTDTKNQLVDLLRKEREAIRRWGHDVEPYNSIGLSRDEETLVFDNPAVLYPDEVDEQTGLPLSNAQAAQRLLEEMGTQRYTQWVDAVYRRRQREQQQMGSADEIGETDEIGEQGDGETVSAEA